MNIPWNIPLLPLASMPPRPEEEPTGRPLRIAIVGLGPKGLFCLERLALEMQRKPPQGPVEIVLIEPHPYPGAGPVYDPRQPAYLRMNLATRHIDAWSRDDRSTGDAGRQSLADWLADRFPEHSDPRGFASRAVVGQYLHDTFHRVVASFPSQVHVTHLEKSVRHAEQIGETWRLELEDHEARISVDELLVTVGHGRWQGGDEDLSARWYDEGVYIPAVFPTDHWLSIEAVPPGSVVAMRGFALTWIDATLALFEGRGGKFVPRGDGEYDYHGTDLEPECVIPFSRTGRAMLAKPTGALALDDASLDSVWRRGLRRLRDACSPDGALDFGGDLLPVVLQAAAEALAAAEPSFAERPVKEIAARLRSWLTKRCAYISSGMAGEMAVADMRQSLQVARGQRPLDAGWAFGAAWRHLYPALVERISHGGLAMESWVEFQQFAAEMERIAFGPPAENVARILALIDAGKIDLRYLQHPQMRAEGDRLVLNNCGAPQVPPRAADRLVHAVIPSPSSIDERSLLGRLISDGHARRLHGELGIQITPAGQCIGCDGRPTPGLAVIGRPTEGCVVGNDTLSRSLHDHPRQWAAQTHRRVLRSTHLQAARSADAVG